MPRITAITAHPRKPGRYSVAVDGKVLTLVDGETTALVDAALLHTHRAKQGAELSDGSRDALIEGALTLQAMDRAVGMLGRRAYARRELERALSQKGTPRPQIDAVVTRLVESGLVDDRAFAENFARARLAGRGQSRRRVSAELSKRGVSRADADAALARIVEDEGIDELAQARKAGEKKSRALAKLEPDVARRRLTGYLVRQGFGGEVVRKVTAELLGRGAW